MDILDDDTPTARAVCYRCLRPKRVCYCAHIPTLPTRTHVVFLQHLRERRMPIGTARMAHLALPNSEFLVGIDFANDPRIQALAQTPGTYLLFPGPNAKDASTLPPGELKNLVVVDGTWPLARKLIKVNPLLLNLPQVAFTPEKPGNYRIRKEPAEHCLSTIEAVAEILGHLEGEPERLRTMLRAFDAMVDKQIDFASQREGPSRYRPRVPRRPKQSERIAEALQAEADALVIVYAESNLIPDPASDERRHELVHLVAWRPRTDEHFEALMKPSGALDPSTPVHLELSAEEIAAGEFQSSGRERWAAFFGEGTVLAGWGYFTHALVREWAPEARYVDIRERMVRVLRRKPGGLDEAALMLGVGTPVGRGRAGRRLTTLKRVYEALSRAEIAPVKGPLKKRAAPAGR